MDNDKKELLKVLKACLGWTYRAMELEVSGSMAEAQERDIEAAKAVIARLGVGKRGAQ